MITLDQIQVNIIKAIRNSSMTQAELGARLGVSQSCISHYIKGDVVPSLTIIANICALLNVDANSLLCLQHRGDEL